MKITSVIAKSEDGDVQIIFTIPYDLIKKAREETLSELAHEVDVPGFRKGKAPLSKVEEKVPREHLIEHTLGKILPEALSNAIREYKLKPAIYPRFELISAKEGENWQISAKTCEIAPFELPDYKKLLPGIGRSKAIWTPGKDKSKEPHSAEASRDEKEQEVIKFLLDSTKVSIPKMLIEEEVNARLSNLLDRIEKLGLSLESYLASLGKNPEALRTEYGTQAKTGIALELILEKIAEDQNIKIQENQIDEVLKASGGDSKQRRQVASILRRRAALDSLIALV